MIEIIMKYVTITYIALFFLMSFFVYAPLKGQTKMVFETDITTEAQTGFRKNVNWVSLFQTNLDICFPQEDCYQGGKISIALISTFKTAATYIANDQQGFSNIEATDLLLSPFLVGYSQYIRKCLLFAGLRNMNEDYFSTDYTALFTQSSAGIHPTLSGNFELPNFPKSGLCLFLEVNPSAPVRLRSSIYNGVSGTFYKKKNTPFRFDYQNQGLFIIQDLLYQKWGSRYNLGTMAHFAGDKEKQGWVIWALIEKPVYSDHKMEIGVIIDGSYALMSAPQCSSYGSFGIIADGLAGMKGKSIISSRVFYAAYPERNEFDLEINWIYRFNKQWQIQPALHLIRTDCVHPVALLRGAYFFNRH